MLAAFALTIWTVNGITWLHSRRVSMATYPTDRTNRLRRAQEWDWIACLIAAVGRSGGRVGALAE